MQNQQYASPIFAPTIIWQSIKKQSGIGRVGSLPISLGKSALKHVFLSALEVNLSSSIGEVFS